MSMAPAEEVKLLEAVNTIHATMNIGFEKVHRKIDEKFDLCDDRFDLCDDRLQKVETDIAVKNAVRKVQKESTDFWRWIIRSVTVAGAISLMYIAVKLLTFGAKL